MAEDKRETEEPKKVRRDRYHVRTLYYRDDQSSANFDNMLHAKCIDFTYVRRRKSNGITCASGYATLTPEYLSAVRVGTSVCGLFRDKLQGLRTIIFVLA